MPLAVEDSRTFSRVITQWRMLRGYSQHELGRIVGHSQRHISFIENARTKPSRDTVERLINALSIPPRDGNRLLNMLGYAEALDTSVSRQELSEASLSLIQDSWITGMHPYPAYVADEQHRVIKLNLSMAMWMNRVADIDAIFDAGRLSWPALIFHPEGLRNYIDEWEALAEAYLQIVNRVMLRDPSTGRELMTRVRRLFDVPSDWQRMTDRYSGTIGMTLNIKTVTGPVTFDFAVMEVAAPPSQPGKAFTEFLTGAVVPVGQESKQQIQALLAKVTPENIHENLVPGLVI